MNVKNYEVYEKIQFVKELSGVARVDGGEETTTKDRRGEEDMVGKVEETTGGAGGGEENGGGDGEATECGDTTCEIFCSN